MATIKDLIRVVDRANTQRPATPKVYIPIAQPSSSGSPNTQSGGSVDTSNVRSSNNMTPQEAVQFEKQLVADTKATGNELMSGDRVKATKSGSFSSNLFKQNELLNQGYSIAEATAYAKQDLGQTNIQTSNWTPPSQQPYFFNSLMSREEIENTRPKTSLFDELKQTFKVFDKPIIKTKPQFDFEPSGDFRQTPRGTIISNKQPVYYPSQDISSLDFVSSIPKATGEVVGTLATEGLQAVKESSKFMNVIPPQNKTIIIPSKEEMNLLVPQKRTLTSEEQGIYKTIPYQENNQEQGTFFIPSGLFSEKYPLMRTQESREQKTFEVTPQNVGSLIGKTAQILPYAVPGLGEVIATADIVKGFNQMTRENKPFLEYNKVLEEYKKENPQMSMTEELMIKDEVEKYNKILSSYNLGEKISGVLDIAQGGLFFGIKALTKQKIKTKQEPQVFALTGNSRDKKTITDSIIQDFEKDLNVQIMNNRQRVSSARVYFSKSGDKNYIALELGSVKGEVGKDLFGERKVFIKEFGDDGRILSKATGYSLEKSGKKTTDIISKIISTEQTQALNVFTGKMDFLDKKGSSSTLGTFERIKTLKDQTTPKGRIIFTESETKIFEPSKKITFKEEELFFKNQGFTKEERLLRQKQPFTEKEFKLLGSSSKGQAVDFFKTKSAKFNLGKEKGLIGDSQSFETNIFSSDIKSKDLGMGYSRPSILTYDFINKPTKKGFRSPRQDFFMSGNGKQSTTLKSDYKIVPRTSTLGTFIKSRVKTKTTIPTKAISGVISRELNQPPSKYFGLGTYERGESSLNFGLVNKNVQVMTTQTTQKLEPQMFFKEAKQKQVVSQELQKDFLKLNEEKLQNKEVLKINNLFEQRLTQQQRLNQSQQLRQQQRIKEVQAQFLGTRQPRQVYQPNYPTNKPTITIKPKNKSFETLKNTNKQKPQEQSFFLTTRKRGKEVLLFDKPLSRGEALSLGVKEVKTTPRATFNLIPTTRKAQSIGIRPIREEEVFSLGFRRPKSNKKDSFVQLRNTRMSNPLEVQTIKKYKKGGFRL